MMHIQQNAKKPWYATASLIIAATACFFCFIVITIPFGVVLSIISLILSSVAITTQRQMNIGFVLSLFSLLIAGIYALSFYMMQSFDIMYKAPGWFG